MNNKTKLYENQKNSLYELQLKLDLSRDALYKYARKKRNIDNMPVKNFLMLASLEKIDPYELYNEIKKYLN